MINALGALNAVVLCQSRFLQVNRLSFQFCSVLYVNNSEQCRFRFKDITGLLWGQDRSVGSGRGLSFAAASERRKGLAMDSQCRPVSQGIPLFSNAYEDHGHGVFAFLSIDPLLGAV